LARLVSGDKRYYAPTSPIAFILKSRETLERLRRLARGDKRV